jgi:thiamine phosphate synthase YjbQ (UPF0047 family)
MALVRKIKVGTILVAILITAASFAADDHDEVVKRDLFAVITLQGQPCGKVVSFQRQGENDYLVTCQTGDRYHVNVVSGRVNVEKQ